MGELQKPELLSARTKHGRTDSQNTVKKGENASVSMILEEMEGFNNDTKILKQTTSKVP